MISTESVLFARSESSSVTAVMAAVLVMVLPPVAGSTVACIVRVAVVVVVTYPTAHTPAAKVPWLTTGVPNSVTPVGKESVNSTPVASSGPELVTVMV